jgi:hypothetical protein
MTKKKSIREIVKKDHRTLEDVHKVFKKWMHIKDLNTIDLILATALSTVVLGSPLWIIILAPSSSGKSEMLRSCTEIKRFKVKVIDEITANTLASGAKKKNGEYVKDLGYELQNTSTLLITPDMATLTSKNKDEKREIFAKFRELYDMFITLRNGNEVIKSYKDCHVTWIFAGVPKVRNEILMFSEIGTRELLYEEDTWTEQDRDMAMEKALENADNEKEMKEEISDTVSKFVASHVYKKNNEIPEEIKQFIKTEAKRLEILRASAQSDKRTAELIDDVTPAEPLRSLKQFKKLFIALKSLDKDYPDEKAKQIIDKIVSSSCDPVRDKIMDMFINSDEGMDYTINDLCAEIRVGKFRVGKQCNVLWNMKFLEKDTREVVDSSGRVQERDFYKLSKKGEKIRNETKKEKLYQSTFSSTYKEK